MCEQEGAGDNNSDVVCLCVLLRSPIPDAEIAAPASRLRVCDRWDRAYGSHGLPILHWHDRMSPSATASRRKKWIFCSNFLAALLAPYFLFFAKAPYLSLTHLPHGTQAYEANNTRVDATC